MKFSPTSDQAGVVPKEAMAVHLRKKVEDNILILRIVQARKLYTQTPSKSTTQWSMAKSKALK